MEACASRRGRLRACGFDSPSSFKRGKPRRPRRHGASPAAPLERVVFHGHSTRGISYYCYPRNYWWFYRPYTTANDGYARCMPYFHYPSQSYRGGGEVK